MSRKSSIERKTGETGIVVSLDIDGSGQYSVDVDDQFLKHMTETFVRYSSFDLKMKAYGDDKHHLIEDVAITLGKAFAEALDKKPVERMGSSVVAMDDALVMAVVDIVDRPYCETDCPDPLYTHWFRSFAMSSCITLHIVKIRGFDDHHIIEASFKALGKALAIAVKPRKETVSTKSDVEMKKC